MARTEATPPPKPSRRKIIGIIGGLGPYAHVYLELQLLQAARELAGAVQDQDYPEWILSSVPQTPDRTRGILDPEAENPLPWLWRSLARLEPRIGAGGVQVPGADFVVIACNTAHYHLETLRRSTDLPLWSLVQTCADWVAEKAPPATRVGILATEGTLISGLYHRPLAELGLRPVSLLDDPDDGPSKQRSWVNEPIYGRPDLGIPGIKAQGVTGEARSRLRRGADHLVHRMGCGVLIAACTEISTALPDAVVHDVPLVDPVRLICRRAIRHAYGLDGGAPHLAEVAEAPVDDRLPQASN